MAEHATVPVPFFPGDGTDAVLVNVAYIAADFPRGAMGMCAYCYGDSCAERSGTDTLIGAFMLRNQWAETCPMCHGRPT